LNPAHHFLHQSGWRLIGRLIVLLYLVSVCNEFIGKRALDGIAQILGMSR